MKTIINLNKAEIQSNFSRISFAERLILQLPLEHDGKNTWLLNYGLGEESINLRENRNLKFLEETQSCELIK